ncbi:MAG TPA: acyl-CoA dehydrogenase family protein, partial [Longimicrobiaceae bacterium]|nr:acyl-CoA dehydrogenase family protein [Longimicrobiaceae bacterium]
MDFSLSPEQNTLMEEVAALADGLDDDVLRRDRESAFSEAAWRRCGEARLPGLPVPEAYGGRGCDLETTALALEAFARACSDEGLAFSLCSQMQCCALPVSRYGSPEQKERLLPRLCRGEVIGGNAATEPETGSDVFAMRTTAVRDGGDYVLDGCKSCVSNGPVADLLVVYAATHPEHRQYGGISAFLVEKGTAGLEIGENVAKIGLRTVPWCDVRLTGCRVQAACMLGEEGAGAEIFTTAMQWERLLIPMVAVGRMAATLDTCLAYARRRRQFGQAIGKHQSVANRLVQMKADLESSRLLLYRAAWLQGRGEKAVLETSLAKLVTTERRIRSCLHAIQVHGARGCREDFEIERELRNAVPGTLSSGTSEMQQRIIAR